jgi:uncharacterized protein YjiS (DUF1127 family)
MRTGRLYSRFNGSKLAPTINRKHILKEKAMFKSSASRRTRSPVTSFSALLAPIVAWTGGMLRRMRAVDQLSDLSDAHLRDIGIDRREIGPVVERELARLRRSDVNWPK